MPTHRLAAGAYRDNQGVSEQPLPRLRRSSLRTETVCDSSAAPLVSPGPGRSRLPAGTWASRKSRGEGYAQAPVPTAPTRGVSGEPLPRLRRSSLRTETVCDSSAAPLASPGPGRSRLPAGTRTSPKTRGEGYAQAPVPTAPTREVSGERLPRLRRSSLRTETLSDFSAAPLASSGPGRSRLPAGTLKFGSIPASM